MLKQLLRQLLKINWIRREVEAYKQEQEDKRIREDWARKLYSSSATHFDDDARDDVDDDDLKDLKDGAIILTYADGHKQKVFMQRRDKL